MSSGIDAQLFRLLAQASLRRNRPFLSGSWLAGELGISRTAVWKHVEALRLLGMDIEALPRRGYRLGQPVAALDAAALRAAFPEAATSIVRRVDCLWETGSTNADLLARTAPPAGHSDVLAAELQHGGRGRRGRRWHLPPGTGLCLSWSWSLDSLPAHAGCLSLAIGVSALRALHDVGIDDVGLKWPNDLLRGDAKAGGILIELRAESGGPTLVVVGIGLNLLLPRHLEQVIRGEGNEATGLCVPGQALPDRNLLAAALVQRGIAALESAASSGFQGFRSEYDAADRLRGRLVAVERAVDTLHGVAAGVDDDGALILETVAGPRRIVSGDVSVRAQLSATPRAGGDITA